MLTLPKIVNRKQVDYVYVRSTSQLKNIKRQFPLYVTELRAYLKDIGVKNYGPAMMRVNSLMANGDRELEFGFPTKEPVPASGPFRAGIVPAGEYATITWMGNYPHLAEVNHLFDCWAKGSAIRWAGEANTERVTFTSKIELFHTNPETDDDPAKWKTEIAIMIDRS